MKALVIYVMYIESEYIAASIRFSGVPTVISTPCEVLHLY